MIYTKKHKALMTDNYHFHKSLYLFCFYNMIENDASFARK